MVKNKKAMIVQAVIVLFVSFLMLTTASFAWFVTSLNPSTQSFTVNVVGTADVDLVFYRNISGTYEPLDEEFLANSFVSNENLVPNIPVYCRVDIINKQDRPIKVGLAFTGINFSVFVNGSETPTPEEDRRQAALAYLYDTSANGEVNVPPVNPKYSIQYAIESNPPNSSFRPEQAAHTMVNVIHYQNQTYGISNSVQLFHSVVVSEGKGTAVSVYYQFLLSPDFKEIKYNDELLAFNLMATGVSVSADFI